MTQSPIAAPTPDDIVIEDDSLNQRLDRQADAILASGEDDSFAPTTSVRQAVKDDAERVRQMVSHQIDDARDGIRDEPIRTTLYALGVGVIIGMWLRR
ncbi:MULTISPECIES: hypothetical protein [unclassified Brevundimonas]|uniref:hypothetical protein n=1 Tax=unclassified Brevundimonas TaxID=2622653 RepID=UPI0020055EB5|nr:MULTISPECIES: hypothetical protein [unclassified Brevundimonas]MCK6102972.1 hypothetical protein [Brevundimonas sp. EYE_349]